MSFSHYIIRNYRPDDFDNYVRLHVEAKGSDMAGYPVSPAVLLERLGQPNCTPEKDLLLAEAKGNILGYMNITPEPDIGRAVLDCLIHPYYRRKGIATQLYYNAISRSSAVGAKVVQVCISNDNAAARNFLSKLNFRFVRRFLELNIDLSRTLLEGNECDGYECRHIRPGEEALLAEIQNRSFAGTWGYHPNTVEDIVYRTCMSDCCPEGIVLLCYGDKPAGYCWTTMNMEGRTASEVAGGRIYMTGVNPEHRRKGLGKYLLSMGLMHLKSRGVEIVVLTVDSENKEACELYSSFGFNTYSTTEWYEKPPC